MINRFYKHLLIVHYKTAIHIHLKQLYRQFTFSTINQSVRLCHCNCCCRQCPRINARKAAVVECEVIDDPNVVECDQCGKRLINKYTLKKHVRRSANTCTTCFILLRFYHRRRIKTEEKANVVAAV